TQRCRIIAYLRRARSEKFCPSFCATLFLVQKISSKQRKETMRKIPELQTLMTGLAFGESPRWHADRLWFSDWGAQEVIAVDLEGKSEVITRIQSFPFCIDFLPDGRLLVVSARDQLLLRMEPDGSLVTHANLTSLSDHPWIEIDVYCRCNVNLNNIGHDLPGVECHTRR